MEFMRKTINQKTKEQVIEQITTEQAINLAISKFNQSYLQAIKELENSKTKLEKARQEVADKLAKVKELQGLKDSFNTKLGKVE